MQIILVDTFGFFFRSYYALPPLQNSKAFPTSLLTGFATLVDNLYKDNKDSCIIFTLEGQGTNKRKELYKDYKANRKEAPQDLLLQLPVAINWLHQMGLKTISLEGYEADDCIASLANLAMQQNHEIQIISHDKDLYQLINEKIHIFDYGKKQKITQKECMEKFGVLPCDFITYQSIVGDTSDNIPGIKGIGPKGAQQIISSFKTLESLYECIEKDFTKAQEILSKRTLNLIKEHKENAFLSRELVTLKKDLFDNFDFLAQKNTFETSPLLKILHELEEYELQRILQKIQPKNYKKNKDSNPTNHTQSNTIQEIPKQQSFNFQSHLITDEKELFTILEGIPTNTPIAFDCETNGLDVQKADMVGFSFCFDGINGYYVPFLHGGIKRESKENNNITIHELSLFNASLTEENIQNNAPKQISQKNVKKALSIIFTHPIIGHNLKFDMHIAWHNFGIRPQNVTKDSMILAWLHNSNQSFKLDNLMMQHFSHKMIAFQDIVPKNATFDTIELELASKYASEDAVATYKLYELLENTLESQLVTVAHDVEFPFIQTLCIIEDSGIYANKEHFHALRHDFQQKLTTLQQEIYKTVGSEFNINSTKQLQEILFEKLGLEAGRKGKNGYSTDEVTLTNLQDSHPVIPLLLEYREIFKLFSTYIEPILKLKKQHERIYTSFIQTGTSTGRLSSKSPNLQNIPVRSQLGKSIRQGFEAQEGNMLVSLDYSQIELRLLAHFSKDDVLVQSFLQNADIHTETAKRLFPDTYNKDSSNLRSIAKSINFGLIYGMGARKLSQTLQIPQKDAKQYIENYFMNFPSVKQFLQAKKDEILESGFAQTLLGRKRHFDFFSATEFMKSNYLREGVNTIFQGSAADLIKMSMNAITNQIFTQNDTKMLLQVHDELIFEIKEDNAQEIGIRLKEIMENIYPLHIPLVCNLSIGKTWADLK